MCGLVSMISRKPFGFTSADLDLMQNLLLLDQIRGDDSTGVFTVLRDKNITITKVGSHPMHLFTTPMWSKHRSKAIQMGRMMVGHNRAATRGAVTSANAHPFHENNIILVHNGTLREDHKKLAEVEVDSHAVCHAFNELGAEAVLKNLHAAFAFIWWDIDKEKLFAVRNDERPLGLVITEDFNFLCSEPWMAEALLRRNNTKVEKVITLKPGDLYEFSLDGSYKTRPIELRAPIVHTIYPETSSWRGHGRPTGRFADLDEDDDVFPKLAGSGQQVVTQTPFETAAADSMAECNLTPFVRNEFYEKGEEVLIQIFDAKPGTSGEKLRITGSVVEPGKPVMDFVGYLPATIDKGEVVSFMNNPCLATIISFSKSVCGDSMWVKDVKLAHVVKVHNTDIALKAWNYIERQVHCKDCGNGVKSCDAPFTGVSMKATGEYRVSCADCIETKLSGEVKNVFSQRRLDAIQNGVPVSPQPTSRALSLVKPQGTTTLH